MKRCSYTAFESLTGILFCVLTLLSTGASCTLAAESSASVGHEVSGLNPDSLLEDYLELAALNHPALKASFERWISTRSMVANEKGWPDPVISYGYYIEPVQTAVGPQQHRIGINQSIPWFGKLSSKGSAAEQAALAAEQDYLAERLHLFERVGKAYYEYAYLAEAIRVTEENLGLLTDQEIVARARYRTQSASYSELIKAQVEQGVLADRLSTLLDRRGAVGARLNETLGRESGSPLPWPASLASPEFAAPDQENIRELILLQNPQLQSLDRQILSTESRVEAAHRNGLPDFNLGVQTILTGDSELTNFPGQGKDAWVVTLAVAVPLWHGQYSGAEDAARADRRMLEYRYQEKQLDLLAEAEELLFVLRDAERKIDLYRDGLIPKARQALEATARAFQTGEASFLDFVDAQRTLLIFQLDHARARADYGQRVLNVARLVGTAPIKLDPTPNSGTEVKPDPIVPAEPEESQR